MYHSTAYIIISHSTRAIKARYYHYLSLHGRTPRLGEEKKIQVETTWEKESLAKNCHAWHRIRVFSSGSRSRDGDIASWDPCLFALSSLTKACRVTRVKNSKLPKGSGELNLYSAGASPVPAFASKRAAVTVLMLAKQSTSYLVDVLHVKYHSQTCMHTDFYLVIYLFQSSIYFKMSFPVAVLKGTENPQSIACHSCSQLHICPSCTFVPAAHLQRWTLISNTTKTCPREFSQQWHLQKLQCGFLCERCHWLLWGKR